MILATSQRASSRSPLSAGAPEPRLADGTVAVQMMVPPKSRDIPNVDMLSLCDVSPANPQIQLGTIDRLADLMGRNPGPHRHVDCLQIHFIESGHFDLVLDECSYSGQGPAVFLTPPSVPHVFALRADAKGHVLTVQQDLFWEVMRQGTVQPDRQGVHPFCVTLEGAEGEEAAAALRTSFVLLGQELQADDAVGRWGQRSLVGYIVAKVSRFRPVAPKSSPMDCGRLSRFRQFLELVEVHYADHWPVARYARCLNITQSCLYELCQDCADRTPKAVVTDRLVQEMRRYLVFSEIGMKDLAATLGFEDTNYFFRFFKRATGETPSTYRQRARR